MKEGALKKKNTIATFICRFALIAAVLLLQSFGGLTKPEVQKLLYIILPLTCLYLALLIKFIVINKRYLIKGQTVSRAYYMQGFILLTAVYLLELIVVLLKGFFNWITTEELYLAVFLIECILGLYAGLYLSDLFAKKDNADLT